MYIWIDVTDNPKVFCKQAHINFARAASKYYNDVKRHTQLVMYLVCNRLWVISYGYMFWYPNVLK